MTFDEALSHMRNSRMLHRRGWSDKNCFIIRASEYRRSHMCLVRGGAGYDFARWIPGLDDFDADDWEIVGFTLSEPR